jgi:hypothetical protein
MIEDAGHFVVREAQAEVLNQIAAFTSQFG